MGNGGCGCNVTNYNLVTEPLLIRKAKSNKLLEMDLNKIDLKLCEEYEIGPYLTKSFKTNLSSTYMNKSLSCQNSFINQTNHPEITNINKRIDQNIDYKILVSQSSLLRIYNRILETPDQKLRESFYFCWNNTLRMLFYIVVLLLENKFQNKNIQKEFKTSSSEKLILKDNSIKSKEENREETLLYAINKDVPRTIPNHKISSNKIFAENLRDILLIISEQDQVLGYVQGMNYINAFILILTGNQKKLSLDIFKSILHMHSDLFQMNFKGILCL